MIWEIDARALRRELKKRPDGPAFLAAFESFVRGDEAAYRRWVAERIRAAGHYNGSGSADACMVRDRELVQQISAEGIRVPLTIWADGPGIQIDGWHRLAIACVLGHPTVPAVRKENHPALDTFSRRVPLTLLIAHPDDEWLFLWPFLPYAGRVVCVVSDRDNAERARYRRRADALVEICKARGLQYHCLEASSGFYRMPTRRVTPDSADGPLKAFLREIGEKIDGQVVATHNSWGEYGHIDHMLCHHAARTYARMTLCTDIAVERDWLPIQRWHFAPALWIGLDASRQTPAGNAEFALDRVGYEAAKAIYEKYDAWTWDGPPPETARVYVC